MAKSPVLAFVFFFLTAVYYNAHASKTVHQVAIEAGFEIPADFPPSRADWLSGPWKPNCFAEYIFLYSKENIDSIDFSELMYVFKALYRDPNLDPKFRDRFSKVWVGLIEGQLQSVSTVSEAGMLLNWSLVFETMKGRSEDIDLVLQMINSKWRDLTGIRKKSDGSQK